MKLQILRQLILLLNTDGTNITDKTTAPLSVELRGVAVIVYAGGLILVAGPAVLTGVGGSVGIVLVAGLITGAYAARISQHAYGLHHNHFHGGIEIYLLVHDLCSPILFNQDLITLT